MKEILKKDKRISDDTEVKNGIVQDNLENDGEKPKTETAIVKSILLDKINKRMIELDNFIEKYEGSLKLARIQHPGIEEEYKGLKNVRRLLTSLPDILYTVHRTNSEVLEIKGLDGSCFELSFIKQVIGGQIYQLKNNVSGQSIDIISSDYLDKVERSCVNGYLFPDDLLSQALEQLGAKNE